MSGNEYEAFEITDYDLANEFNPNRPRRKLTKNQQIYGIWADSDSDADSEAEMTGRRRGKGRSSGPVSFVTGGIQQSGSFKKDENEKDDNNQITDEEDDDRSHHPAVQGKDIESDSNSSSDEEKVSSKPARMGFGMKQRQPSSSNKPVGAWEQHTKGIGAKLLLQMGYKPGMGLGKDLQGIAQPVQAHLRKGRGAIGAYGPETPATIGDSKEHKPIEDQDERETREFKEKLNKWKKDDSKKESKKNRYYYRSVEEVIEKGKKLNSNILPSSLSKKLGNVPVIDMTGPEKRVLSGYHALGQTKIIDEELYQHNKNKKATGFDLPELKHNLNLIVNQCEQDIISLDKEQREASEEIQSLEHEKLNLEKIVRLEKDHIETLEKAVVLLDELTSDSLSLSRAEKIFVELQRDYAAEYKEFALGDLAAGVIAPMVNNELKSWKPLEEPLRFIETIKKWRTILHMHKTEQRNNVFDPYSSLVWAGVIPSFRATVNEWNPKMHQKMAALLDSWAPLFPTWVLDNVLEQLILPRLSAGVNEWDPLTDTIPIHSWILPWNTILGHKMEEHIFPTIRDKLGSALQAWIPQDRSARAMLTPWKEAFEAAEMQAFLLKHIIPKLQMALNDMIINPLQQDLELWNQVWEWNELIPPLLLGQMLDKYFFPKWMQVLVLWLNQAPDFDQISRWYTGWKTVLGEELLKLPNIKEHLRRALEMMHRATETASTPQPVPTPVAAPQPASSSSTLNGPPALMDLQIAPPSQLEFKELVSQKCAERGVIFAPMPGRREFGKQVYRVGKLFCYIDRNVVMLSDGSLKNWTPTSLGLTIERALSG